MSNPAQFIGGYQSPSHFMGGGYRNFGPSSARLTNEITIKPNPNLPPNSPWVPEYQQKSLQDYSPHLVLDRPTLLANAKAQLDQLVMSLANFNFNQHLPTNLLWAEGTNRFLTSALKYLIVQTNRLYYFQISKEFPPQINVKNSSINTQLSTPDSLYLQIVIPPQLFSLGASIGLDQLLEGAAPEHAPSRPIVKYVVISKSGLTLMPNHIANKPVKVAQEIPPNLNPYFNPILWLQYQSPGYTQADPQIFGSDYKPLELQAPQQFTVPLSRRIPNYAHTTLTNNVATP